MNEILPARLAPVYSPRKWLDLIFKSDLPVHLKLLGAVLSNTASYHRRDQVAYTDITPYVVSRFLKCNVVEAEAQLKELVDLGWLYPARGISHALSISRFPVRMRS